MTLGDYLAADRPAWDWINLDCCRWVDRWLVLNGHASPMAAIGIQYDSETSALRRIVEGGGLAALWTRGMTAAGIPLSVSIWPGDVGVVRLPTACGLDEAMGIWTGERWATLGLRGLEFGPAEIVRGWRV